MFQISHPIPQVTTNNNKSSNCAPKRTPLLQGVGAPTEEEPAVDGTEGGGNGSDIVVPLKATKERTVLDRDTWSERDPLFSYTG